MAAELPLPHSSFFNIYNDAPAITSLPSLPGGSCNYVDLTPGSSGKKCGCVRFWSRSALGRGTPTGYPDDQVAWCACSHHACFHNDTRDVQTPTGISAFPLPPPSQAGQENERPRTNREPLTPVNADISLRFPQPVDQQHINLHTFSGSHTFPDYLERPDTPPAGMAEPGEPLLPDTLDWAEFLESQSRPQSSLAPIPRECLMASQTESTTSSARITYLKPFAGKGLNTLSGVRSREPEVALNEGLPAGHAEEPLEDQVDDDARTVTNTPGSSRYRDTPQPEERSPVLTVTRQSFNELSVAVEGYKDRIEALEQVEQEEPCDMREHADSERVYELEQRVLAVEKVLNADDKTVIYESHGHSSSDPSQEPWEIEVVFLPFPLKTLWSRSCDFTGELPSTTSSIGADSWTLPTRVPLLEAHSSDSGEWAGPEVESDWLFGRALKSDNLMDRRLRSRGLVKTVAVRNEDAHSVNEAIVEAFGTLFQTLSRMQANVHHGSTTHPRRARFLGLESPWVPLRKVKHDSRLRFLTPAEMVTPVTWTVPFLKSSVMFKSSKMSRLFVTQPEAYLQDLDAYEHGWTWPRLRGLSRVCADSQGSDEGSEDDEEDPNWTWNSKLDENAHICPGYQTSGFYETAQPRQRTTSVITSPETFADARSKASSFASRRAASRTKSPAVLQERRYPRPPRLRTASVPPTPQTLVSPAITARRVTSYGHPYERYSSPQPTRSGLGRAQMVAVVKRRGTRSPSVSARPRFSRFTPGMSTGVRSPTPDIANNRFDTPYYATPYSIAPVVDPRPHHEDVILIDGDFDFNYGESDIDVYDEEADDYDQGDALEGDYSDDASMTDLGHGTTHLRSQDQESWQDGQVTGPEDEPWPGIEDDENRDPDVVNIHIDADAMVDEGIDNFIARAEEDDTSSRGSSVPSEYPSNDPEWVTSGKEHEFRPFGA